MNAKLLVMPLMLVAAVMPQISLAAEQDAGAYESRLAAFIGVHDWGGLADLQSADG